MILGKALLEWLDRAGIETAMSDHIVIDIRVGEPVKIYVERYGDDRLLKLDAAAVFLGSEIEVIKS